MLVISRPGYTVQRQSFKPLGSFPFNMLKIGVLSLKTVSPYFKENFPHVVVVLSLSRV